tara:strand:+ start:3811 stop:5466 length:1656 start_codon:yes stop_codon:yes gene_type:complete
MIDISKYSAKSIRTLIDKYFSLQWCRENLVIPTELSTSLPPQPRVMTIAVANIAFLGTVGPLIKQRVDDSGISCRFIELSSDDIQSILDLCGEERIISGETVDLDEFTEEAVLEALKDSIEDPNSEEFLIEFDDTFDEDNEEEQEEVTDIEQEMLSSKTQKAAGLILINAYKSNFSDIHIEPKQENYKIRVRKDGVMQKFLSMSLIAGKQLVACLKNMAQMDIAERRASQDGKIYRKYIDNKLEFRCSTAPGKHGEGMVLRILKSDSNLLNLDTLIHVEKIREHFRKIIQNNNGIVIVSGPTGSGKSTTLASALRERDNGEMKIVTAEDPIEYDLGGDIIQHQINRAKKQTFANLLRTFLRQDPDIILIGETRDPETAESSMDAAETGHLVFTTLHSNSSVSSLSRLQDMGVAVYKINSSVRAILAQRLIRKVCPHCSVERPISSDEAKKLGVGNRVNLRYATVLSALEKEKRRKEGTLCKSCNGIGYSGRIGVYELLELSRDIQKAIKEGIIDKELEDVATENGMITLYEYGAQLVIKQLTTLSELLRVV